MMIKYIFLEQIYLCFHLAYYLKKNGFKKKTLLFVSTVEFTLYLT